MMDMDKASEDDLDSLLLAHNPRFVQLLEEARARVRVTGGVPLAELRERYRTQSAEADDAPPVDPAP